MYPAMPSWAGGRRLVPSARTCYSRTIFMRLWVSILVYLQRHVVQ